MSVSELPAVFSEEERLRRADVCLFEKIASTSNPLSEMVMAEPALPPTGAVALGLRPELVEKLNARIRGRAVTGGGGGDSGSTAPLTATAAAATSDEDDDNENPSATSSSSSTSDDEAPLPPADGLDGEYFSFFAGDQATKETDNDDIFALVRFPRPEVSAAQIQKEARRLKHEGHHRHHHKASHDDISYWRSVPLWSAPRFELTYGSCYSDNALLALHQEITDFVDWVRPLPEEVAMRRLVEVQILDIAKRLWPQCDVVVYGSVATGLLLPGSDIDMTITNVPIHPEDALVVLCREVVKENLGVSHPQLILKTKVPLVKFMSRTANVDVDISINAIDGKTNSLVVADLLSRFPEARSLIIVIKYFLQQRDMHEPYRGGMGSFATTLLVISFLQMHPIYTTATHLRSRCGLGKLLVDFFRYYGTCFNFHRVGVSLAAQHPSSTVEGFYFTRPPSSGQPGSFAPNGERVYEVMIEDPGNRTNNAASSLRTFRNIVYCFEAAYMALTAEFPHRSEGEMQDPEVVRPDSFSLADRPTLLSRIIHPDSTLVQRRRLILQSYDDFKKSHDPDFVDRVLRYKAEQDRTMYDITPVPRFDGKPSTAPTAATTAPLPAKSDKRESKRNSQGGSRHSSRGSSTTTSGNFVATMPDATTGGSTPASSRFAAPDVPSASRKSSTNDGAGVVERRSASGTPRPAASPTTAAAPAASADSQRKRPRDTDSSQFTDRNASGSRGGQRSANNNAGGDDSDDDGSMDFWQRSAHPARTPSGGSTGYAPYSSSKR